MGEMKRAVAREEQERRNQDRFASTVVIAAATLLRHRSLERVVLVLSALGLAAYTLLALLNVSVP